MLCDPTNSLSGFVWCAQDRNARRLGNIHFCFGILITQNAICLEFSVCPNTLNEYKFMCVCVVWVCAVTLPSDLVCSDFGRTQPKTIIHLRNRTQFITTLFVYKLLQFQIEKLNKSQIGSATAMATSAAAARDETQKHYASRILHLQLCHCIVYYYTAIGICDCVSNGKNDTIQKHPKASSISRHQCTVSLWNCARLFIDLKNKNKNKMFRYHSQ